MESCINLMIKPVSGNCNINCSYCFYQDEMKKRTSPFLGKMTWNTADHLIEKTLAYVTKECSFSFQGGEPTLIGLEFYRMFIECQKKHNVHKIKIQNVIQTNGILFQDEWMEFLKENNFLVGISLDGIKRIHNQYRTSNHGEGTFEPVMKAIDLLKKYEIPFNVLTVVTKEIARSAEKVYRFYQKNQLDYQQYIPCLGALGENRPKGDCLLAPEDYTMFLKTLFDCWYCDMVDGRYVYIRYFENLACMLKGQMPEHCGRMGICGDQWVAEADGSMFPCDFYALDEWYLGNIIECEYEELTKRKHELDFVEESKILPEECKICQWFALCRNGCKRERVSIPDKGSGKNIYCQTYQEFFPYMLGRMKLLLK